MKGLLALIGTTVLGSIGWWLGEQISVGVAVVLGAIGSGAGLYYSRRLFDEWLG